MFGVFVSKNPSFSSSFARIPLSLSLIHARSYFYIQHPSLSKYGKTREQAGKNTGRPAEVEFSDIMEARKLNNNDESERAIITVACGGDHTVVARKDRTVRVDRELRAIEK